MLLGLGKDLASLVDVLDVVHGVSCTLKLGNAVRMD